MNRQELIDRAEEAISLFMQNKAVGGMAALRDLRIKLEALSDQGEGLGDWAAADQAAIDAAAECDLLLEIDESAAVEFGRALRARLKGQGPVVCDICRGHGKHYSPDGGDDALIVDCDKCAGKGSLTTPTPDRVPSEQREAALRDILRRLLETNSGSEQFDLKQEARALLQQNDEVKP